MKLPKLQLPDLKQYLPGFASRRPEQAPRSPARPTQDQPPQDQASAYAGQRPSFEQFYNAQPQYYVPPQPQGRPQYYEARPPQDQPQYYDPRQSQGQPQYYDPRQSQDQPQYYDPRQSQGQPQYYDPRQPYGPYNGAQPAPAPARPAPRRSQLRPGDLRYLFWSVSILAGLVLTVVAFIYACAA